jgi:hypothetical protein
MFTGMPTESTSEFRKLLEDRLSQLTSEVEALAGEARERARRECADGLNQAVRRMRQAAGPEELWATLVDVTAGFASGAALLRVTGDRAVVERVRSADAPIGTEIALASAPALASAVETRDPVVAAAGQGEVAGLADLVGESSGDRVSIFPIVGHDRVVALLSVWGKVEGAAVELLAQAAGAGWLEPVPPPAPPTAPAVPLVTIAPAARSWDTLPATEQQLHLRAQRHARVQVSEMRLFHADAVQAGRAHRDLYGALRPEIDAARESFRQKFFANCASMVDYLHLEMLRTLANDDAELLGKDYPGPLV